MAWTTAAFIGLWPVVNQMPAGAPFAIPVLVVWLILVMAVPDRLACVVARLA
jgi:hypothetical protein